MARSARHRSARRPPAEPKVKSQDNWIEELAQDIKVLNIHRDVIVHARKTRPWSYVGIVVAVILLIGAIAIIWPLGIILAAGGLSGALGHLASTKMKADKANKAIDALQEKIDADLAQLDTEWKPILFGVKSIGRSGVGVTDHFIDMTQEFWGHLNHEGSFAIGPYKFLALALRRPDGTVDYTYEALRGQYWITTAKLKKVPDSVIEASLARLAVAPPGPDTD